MIPDKLYQSIISQSLNEELEGVIPEEEETPEEGESEDWEEEAE